MIRLTFLNNEVKEYSMFGFYTKKGFIDVEEDFYIKRYYYKKDEPTRIIRIAKIEKQVNDLTFIECNALQLANTYDSKGSLIGTHYMFKENENYSFDDYIDVTKLYMDSERESFTDEERKNFLQITSIKGDYRSGLVTQIEFKKNNENWAIFVDKCMTSCIHLRRKYKNGEGMVEDIFMEYGANLNHLMFGGRYKEGYEYKDYDVEKLEQVLKPFFERFEKHKVEFNEEEENEWC